MRDDKDEMKGVNVKTGDLDLGFIRGNKINSEKKGANKVNAGHHNTYTHEGDVNFGNTDNSTTFCNLL